jgi:hypothetical protein
VIARRGCRVLEGLLAHAANCYCLCAGWLLLQHWLVVHQLYTQCGAILHEHLCIASSGQLVLDIA